MLKALRRAGAGLLLALAAYAVALSVVHLLRDGWKRHRVETAWILFGGAVLVGLAFHALRTAGPGREGGSPAPSRIHLALAGAVMLVTLIVYGPALSLGLLSDDFALLEMSPAAMGWGQFFRPLPLGVFRLADRAASQHVAPVLHGLALALHVFNVWLAWRLGRRLGLPPAAGTCAAALFAWFPASVEAVAWCASLQDVMAATGSLAFLALALGSGRAAPMLLALAAAVLSKESAVATPFIAATLLMARDRHVEGRRMAVLAVAGAAAVAFALWRLLAAEAYFNVQPSRHLFKNVLSMAFGTLAAPWSRAELRAMPWLGILMAVTLAAAGVAAVRASGRMPVARLVLALAAWIVLSVAPTYTWLFVQHDLEGSRHLYFASAAWALLLAFVAASAGRRAAPALGGALAVVATVWAFSVAWHVATWGRAAEERDRIVAAAEAVLPVACPRPEFSGATDNVAGAYVFRNGLEAALRRRGAPPAPTTGPVCRYAWDGTRFVAEPDPIATRSSETRP